tara:strand:+ start:1931 stop:3247 length:1317 start_codon:yes stop_codon:yes gene_type:complete
MYLPKIKILEYIIMSVLPKELSYVPLLPSLGESVVNTSVVIQPSNGAVFQEQSIIQIDLPNKVGSYLDPNTVYVRFKINVTSANGAELKGSIPALTCFSNLQTIFGSQIVENIQQYGVVQSMLTNVTHNAAQKAGMAVGYGLTDYPIITAVTTMAQNLNSRTCTLNESFSVSVPLRCILSEAERLIPLGLMSSVRVQLTLASISEMFTSVVVPTGFNISNFEFCYDSINFGSQVDDMVRSMGERIYIKSQSYATSSASLAAASSGSISLLYNTRLSSVKSLFTNFGGTANASLNKLYDSYDVTSSSGSYQYMIGGLPYPARPVSTINNKTAILSELRLAVGGLNAGTTDMSISPVEFNYLSGGVTTARLSSKLFFGTNVERLSTNGNLLTGISTLSSPISLQIETTVPTVQAHNIMCVCLFDALIEVTPSMKDATVKQ